MQGTYLVIGGSKGIGKATAQLLLEQGHTVHIMARSVPEWQGAYTFHAGDVLEGTLPNIGDTLDGLVYCPGSINLRPFKSLKPKDFQADFDINVMGAVQALQHYYPALKKSDKASVVLFSTVAVQTGMAFHASIGAAKGAVEGLVRSLAAEWAPSIRVNGIAPSIMQTDLAARLLRNEKQVTAAQERHPLNSIGQAEDGAALASFLLQPSARWMTGQIIGLDGGMSAVRKL
jgi:NAD(P)-dependent dehydrogenase (short-subunit alcohol dehydrogenase family)